MTEKEKAKAYDKKIREAILNGLIDCRDAPDLGWSNFGGIHIDDCIDWLEKQGEQEQLYIRFGEIPTDEKSKIYRGEIEVGIENGVSVYPAFKTNEGNIVLGLNLPITETTLHTQQHLIEYDNRPCYLVNGDYIGKDTDGQPLINNVSIIEKIDNYRFKEKIGNIDNQNCIKPNNMDKSKSQENDWLEKQRDKDKLIQELGEYKVKYTQEVLEKYINSMSNKDDERLRKTAIAFLKDFAEQGYENAVECIDWLEKQGKNSTDKIEPKFKVSDWVVNKFGDSWHIDSLDKKNYQVSDGKGNYNYFPISKQDEMHLWAIQDAKDGDILSFYTEYRGNKMFQVGIIKKYVGKRGGCSNTFKMYVGVNWDNNLQIGKYMGCSLNIECSDIHPATKEQRDFLFKKLKESGYKWNTKTKTLEKLVEPKFKVGDKIVNVPMKYMGGSWTQGTISKITDDKYIFTDGSYTSISNQDSWELVDDKKHKFDPKTLQPYDKVLIRRGNENFYVWFPDFVSNPPNNDNNKTLCMCVGDDIAMVIPYNNDTKHLIGTTNEAPEFYKYWED